MEHNETNYVDQIEMDKACRLVEERRKARRKRKQIEKIVKTAVISVSSLCIGFAFGARFSDGKQQTDYTNDVCSTVPEKEIMVEIPVKFSPLMEEEFDALVKSCIANNIPVNVALGLIFVESSFKPDALNLQTGCYGYCQLNPRYFPTGLSPVENIQTGINYLGECLTRYDGDLDAALTAYNAGHDTGSRWYANAVMEAAKTWD